MVYNTLMARLDLARSNAEVLRVAGELARPGWLCGREATMLPKSTH